MIPYIQSAPDLSVPIMNHLPDVSSEGVDFDAMIDLAELDIFLPADEDHIQNMDVPVESFVADAVFQQDGLSDGRSQDDLIKLLEKKIEASVPTAISTSSKIPDAHPVFPELSKNADKIIAFPAMEIATKTAEETDSPQLLRTAILVQPDPEKVASISLFRQDDVEIASETAVTLPIPKLGDAAILKTASIALPYIEIAAAAVPLEVAPIVMKFPATSQTASLSATLEIMKNDQWITRIGSEISRSNGADNKLNFQLSPLHLGKLMVEISHDITGETIRFETETETARAIITQSHGRLEQELRRSGISQASFDIFSESPAARQDGHQDNRAGRGKGAQPGDASGHRVESEPGPVSPSSRLVLDRFA